MEYWLQPLQIIFSPLLRSSCTPFSFTHHSSAPSLQYPNPFTLLLSSGTCEPADSESLRRSLSAVCVVPSSPAVMDCFGSDASMLHGLISGPRTISNSKNDSFYLSRSKRLLDLGPTEIWIETATGACCPVSIFPAESPRRSSLAERR